MKVLITRPNPKSKSDGIDVYCNALASMFKDDDSVCVLPIENYGTRNFHLLNGVYKYRKFYNAVKNINPDIIHINGYTSFTVVQAFLCSIFLGKKIVYTPHWHPFEKLNRPLFGKIFFYVLLYPLIKLFAEKIITLNNEDNTFFASISKNTVQIPHWLKFNLTSTDNIIKNESMILFVGRVSDTNKGVEHLFKLPLNDYEIHMVGYGDIDIRGDMKRHMNIATEKLVELYKQASLLVVPSKYEAFSLVSLEALMCGTPIVISENVRIADYLKGISGVSIFKYGDYPDFISKVQETIGKQVDIESIKNIFDYKKIKNQYKELYTKL